MSNALAEMKSALDAFSIFVNQHPVQFFINWCAMFAFIYWIYPNKRGDRR